MSTTEEILNKLDVTRIFAADKRQNKNFLFEEYGAPSFRASTVNEKLKVTRALAVFLFSRVASTFARSKIRTFFPPQQVASLQLLNIEYELKELELKNYEVLI